MPPAPARGVPGEGAADAAGTGPEDGAATVEGAGGEPKGDF